MNEVKCKACNTWNVMDATECNACGTIFIEKRTVEIDQRTKVEKNPLPLTTILPTDTTFTKIWKFPVIIAQLIFISILSLIAAIASSTVH